MKLLILSVILSALTGCISENHKPKTYISKIEFYKPKKMKVLYEMPKEENLPEECYKSNCPDIEIAKKELMLQALRRTNKDAKLWIAIAENNIKKAREFLAREKARMLEREKQDKQIKNMLKELKEIDARIKQKLKTKRKKK